MVQAETITTGRAAQPPACQGEQAQAIAERLCSPEGEITRRLRLVEALAARTQDQATDLCEARDELLFATAFPVSPEPGPAREHHLREIVNATGALLGEVDVALTTLRCLYEGLRQLVSDGERERLAAEIEAEHREPTDTADATSPTQDTSMAGDGGREGTL